MQTDKSTDLDGFVAKLLGKLEDGPERGIRLHILADAGYDDKVFRDAELHRFIELVKVLPRLGPQGVSVGTSPEHFLKAVDEDRRGYDFREHEPEYVPPDPDAFAFLVRITPRGRNRLDRSAPDMKTTHAVSSEVLRRLRGGIESLGRRAKPDAVIAKVRMNRQRGLDGLHRLAELGEYDGLRDDCTP